MRLLFVNISLDVPRSWSRVAPGDAEQTRPCSQSGEMWPLCLWEEEQCRWRSSNAEKTRLFRP